MKSLSQITYDVMKEDVLTLVGSSGILKHASACSERDALPSVLLSSLILASARLKLN